VAGFHELQPLLEQALREAGCRVTRVVRDRPQAYTQDGDREVFTPFGIAGGTNGGGGKLIVNKGTDKEKDVGMYATGVQVKKGDHIKIKITDVKRGGTR
jgi:N-methylhydantoinase B/oxoprolinase/acetone carboxylase alpha subunit